MPALKLNTDAALDVAAKAVTQQKTDRPADEQTKFVNLRIKATDYDRLKKLFGAQGVPIATGCKMASFYIAELIETGAFSITQGGIVDRRKN